MDQIVTALSIALGLSLIGVAVLASLYWRERIAHRAAKEWAEAEQKRFAAYKEQIDDERRIRSGQGAMELVQPLWDQISS